MYIQPPVKTVLIDLDDTLFDHEHSVRCGLMAIKQIYQCFAQQTLDELDQASSLIFDSLWPEVMQGTLSLTAWQTEVFRRLFISYGEPVNDNKICIDAATHFRSAYLHSRQCTPGAVELLTALKSRVIVGVVTNHLTVEQREKLNFCKLTHLIDFLICSEEIGYPKPNRQIFEAALGRANCKAQETVMIGDSWSSDVLGATALGIRTLWYNPYGRPCPDSSLATEITSFDPVEPILKYLFNVS